MSGTPSFPGVSSFAVSVVDKRSASASQPYSVDIVAAEQPQPEPPSSFPVARGHQAKIFERKHIVPITTFGRKYIPAGGGATYVNAEVTAWANNVTTALGTVSAAQGTRVDTMVSGIKADFTITAMSQFFDRFWLFVAENTQQATYDLVGAGHTWTFGGLGTFATQWAPTSGFTGDGIDNYLNSNYNPTTNGVNWTAGSAVVGAYIVNNRTVVANNKCAAGASDGTHDANLYPMFTNSCVYGSINSTSPVNTGAGSVVSSQGLQFVYAYGTGSNNAAITIYTAPTRSAVGYGGNPSGVINLNLYIGALNNSGTPSDYSDDSIACVYFSGSPASVALADKLAARINTYMQGMNAIYHW
jgi:hypothetical protein